MVVVINTVSVRSDSEKGNRNTGDKRTPNGVHLKMFKQLLTWEMKYFKWNCT
jgi:hypothetical protein